MELEEVKKLSESYLFQNYAREDVCFERGDKEFLFDLGNCRYIDYVAGIAVNCLGHNHPAIVRAVTEQAKRMIHVSNLYQVKEQVELGEAIASIVPWPLSVSLFVNSGAEANEAALKLAAKRTGRTKFISTKNSFHGRTAGALAATGQTKYQAGFEPLLSKAFRYIDYSSVEELKSEVTKETAALMLEPLQGEGGVVLGDKEFMKAARDVCSDTGTMLIMDEVQTGFGRTGRWFGFEHFGIVPDIVSCAKALGGGYPIGAIISSHEIARTFTPGSHGTTFGGNPLGCAVATAVINTLKKDRLVERSAVKGEEWMARLRSISKEKSWVKEIRGKGLMIGIEMEGERAKELKSYAFSRKQLTNVVHNTTLRLVPPLVISDQSMKAFDLTFESFLTRA
ncbi:MAG TPA: acetylornithine/succinylornithine family transaminase [Methanomassiliicoccales archaeon]|nr:acetylornithine/succinylornithine family transaminase [Methanomassiliicoccales archaeon]